MSQVDLLEKNQEKGSHGAKDKETENLQGGELGRTGGKEGLEGKT